MFKEVQFDFFDGEGSDVIHAPDNSTTSLSGIIDGVSVIQNDRFLTAINSRGKTIERETVVGDVVDCYRNLNKPSYFSCKQRSGVHKGKVSGYANVIVVEDPSFIVSEASRQRILREKSRNVHAFVRGTFFAAYKGKIKENVNIDLLSVSYSPYLGGSFFRRDNKNPISRDDYRRFAILCGSDVFLTDLNQA